MLLLVSTPIGNISDMSERACLALSSATIVLCEDTRVTEQLYHILEDRNKLVEPKKNRRYISLHKFNEQERIEEILMLLKTEETVVLVSDAGTPAISDPGQRLIEACHKNKIPVSIVPGPCAFVSAFALSGFSCERFQFIGFIPRLCFLK